MGVASLSVLLCTYADGALGLLGGVCYFFPCGIGGSVGCWGMGKKLYGGGCSRPFLSGWRVGLTWTIVFVHLWSGGVEEANKLTKYRGKKHKSEGRHRRSLVP